MSYGSQQYSSYQTEGQVESRQQHISTDDVETSEGRGSLLRLLHQSCFHLFHRFNRKKDVWTDNGVRTVRESLSVYLNTA